MKNLSLLLLSFVLLLGTSACESELDVIPQGAPSSGNFWKTPADAKAGVNAIYALYSDDNMYGRGI